MRNEVEREAGQSAFQPRLKSGPADFEAKFLEARREDEFAGAFEGGKFTGEKVGI